MREVGQRERARAVPGTTSSPRCSEPDTPGTGGSRSKVIPSRVLRRTSTTSFLPSLLPSPVLDTGTYVHTYVRACKRGHMYICRGGGGGQNGMAGNNKFY